MYKPGWGTLLHTRLGHSATNQVGALCYKPGWGTVLHTRLGHSATNQVGAQCYTPGWGSLLQTRLGQSATNQVGAQCYTPGWGTLLQTGLWVRFQVMLLDVFRLPNPCKWPWDSLSHVTNEYKESSRGWEWLARKAGNLTAIF
jgi:hypothetical protein